MPTITPPVRPLRRWLRRLALALPVVAILGYFGGSHLYFAYQFRTAVRAEQTADYPRGERAIAAYLKHAPDDPEARLLAARLGWRARIDELVPGTAWDAPLRKHLKAAEADPRLIERVAREEQLIDALSGKLDAVQAVLARRAAEDGPDRIPTLEVLTWANVAAYRFPVALRWANALLDKNPTDARGHYWRGLIRELTNGAAGPPDADYRRAVELAPANPVYRQRLGDALARTPDTRPDALTVFQALAADRPDDPDALLGLGRCRIDLGDPAAAVEPLRTADRLRPGNAAVLTELGRALMETGKAADAEPLLRKAVALAPNSRPANFALGGCLGRLGRDDDAKPFLDAAARIYADAQRVHELSGAVFANPATGPQLRCELGELLVRTGKVEDGRYWLQTALAIDPAYEPARQALAKLSGGR